MLDGKEAFIQGNMEFRAKDFLRVKGVVVPKLFQDLTCLCPDSSDQRIEREKVGIASEWAFSQGTVSRIRGSGTLDRLDSLAI